jgi:hypothetical protein
MHFFHEVFLFPELRAPAEEGIRACGHQEEEAKEE